MAAGAKRYFGTWEGWTLLAVAGYCLGHWLWYLGTPLGLHPTLDARENLLLAKAIYHFELVREPFYRAMLYPALLATLHMFGEGNVAWLASLLGFCFHIGSTALAMDLSRRLFDRRICGIVAGVLVGMNPVLIHYATDVLDITLGTFLFLLGVHALARTRGGGPPARLTLAGVFLALACLARPHFLAVGVAGLGLVCGLCLARRLSYRTVLMAASGFLAPMLVYAAINWVVGGSFAVTPWQGSYNLWTSNKPMANGLYFRQSVDFRYTGEHRNPNRMESEYFYARAAGREGSIAERNAYWRSRTLESIFENPLRWLRLMVWKTYALANNWEQYNNKTFSVHKQRSPWLRLNPIGWGLLVSLAAMGGVVAWRMDRAAFWVGSLIIVTYAAGVLIYMASGRFRVPLVPLLAVWASGAMVLPGDWPNFSKRQRMLTVGLPLLVAAISFSRFGGIADRSSFAEDYLLLADAAARSGRDSEAIDWAERAANRGLREQPARRIQLISYYNLVSQGSSDDSFLDWLFLANEADGLGFDDPAFLFVRGVAYWNVDRRNDALATWIQAVERHGLDASASLAAIALARPSQPIPDLTVETVNRICLGYHPLLAFAMSRLSEQMEARIRLSVEKRAELASAIERALPGLLAESKTTARRKDSLGGS